MKKLLLTLTCLLLMTTFTYSQDSLKIDEECGTQNLDSATVVKLPYFGNNSYLNGIYEEHEIKKAEEYQQYQKIMGDESISTQSNHCNEVRYLIPVRIIIHRNAQNGTNMENNAQRATDILRIANERFLQAGSDIQFYLQSQVTTRDASPFAQAPLTTAQIQNMFINDLNYNRITIHMIGAESNTAGGELGRANLPITPIDRVCYVRTQGNLVNPTSAVQLGRLGGTLAHELGHVLGLLHTHHPGRFMSTVANFSGGNADVFNRCYQEAVSRTARNRWYEGCLDTDGRLSCQVNGDFLCDTEADPRFNAGGITYNDDPNVCDYQLPANGNYRFDNRGDEWTPNPLNIMARGNRICRNFFQMANVA